MSARKGKQISGCCKKTSDKLHYFALEIVVLGRFLSAFYAAKFKNVKNTGDLTYSQNNCALAFES